jgi:hypothetical protein
MKPLLQQLENESLLLLYMAGELPPEDRDELEIMLQRDGGLRAQLEALRAAHESSFGAIASLDAAEPLQSVEPAMRSIHRSMRQWWIDQMARPQQAPAARSMMPVLAWSVGTAVAALLVFCIWWGFRGGDGNPRLADTQPSNPTSPSQTPLVDRTLGEAVPSVALTGTPDDAIDTASADPNAVQIVTVDSTNQQLADLETSVSEDFASRSRD